MSIWRSPVFYFGVVLVLVVTAALAAPYVVPWNNYRAGLESYGERLTGRSVAIGGDIAVKLFPWPQLEAREVEIGNADGFSDTTFMKADLLRVRLSLGGLFNGGLNVEQVELVAPQVNMQRNASGDVNWIFAPTEQVVGQGLLSRVKLDKILLRDGIVSFDDLRNGHSVLLADLDATLSAQSVLGPWRMQGDAKWNDLPFGITITTNAKTEVEPLRFSVKLDPLDQAYPLAAVEGSWDGALFSGSVRLDPQEADGSKASSEGAFKPLAMQSKLEASQERISLTNMRIAPVDRKDSGTLIEGTVLVELGSQSLARVELRSPRINLDTLMGAEALTQWREGGFLSVSNTMLAHLPAKMVADYALNVSVLTSGGQALNDVRLSGSMQKEAIRVKEFVAELPGRSAASFDGVIFPGDAMAQLGGRLAFESNDFRAFMGWLTPTWKQAFDTHWTGSRGRLVLSSSTLDWTARALGLKDMRFELDGAAGQANFVQTFQPGRGVDLSVKLASLDIDGLLPNGWSFLRDGGLPALVNMAVQPQEGPRSDVRLSLEAETVQLNGVAAQNVALALTSNERGLAVKTLNIGNVGGAQLTGGGTLADLGNGPEGELKFSLLAADPRLFLRLSGLAFAGAQWPEVLGQTAIDATIKTVPQKSGPEIEIVARGSSGPLNMELVATAREIEKLQGATLAASGGINSADSAVLARLVGLEPIGATGPGDLTFEFKGSFAEGFAFGSMLKALDGVARLEGTAQPSQAFFGVTGKFTAQAKDGAALVQATGLPFVAGASQPLDISASVSSKDATLELVDVKAQLAGRRFSGSASMNSAKRLQADLETDLLDARDVFALAFLPLEGVPPGLETGFSDFETASLEGEIFLRPLQFETVTGPSFAETVVGLGFEKSSRQLTITSPGEQGVQADLRMEPQGTAQRFSGTLKWPLDLANFMTAADGTALLSGQLLAKGEWTGSGRNLATVLASLEGKGNYMLSDAKLPRMTLAGLAPAVLGASSPEALSAALAKLTSAPGAAIGQRIGSFTVSNGEVMVPAFDVPLEGLGVKIGGGADLTANRLRVETNVMLLGRADLPAVTMTYEGPVAALQTRVGTSAIAAKLGYELLSKEMAELERLQQEQQKLALKEEQQRRDDEKRFAEYQATRAELRTQLRLRRFQQGERDKQAAAMKAIVEDAIKIGPQRSRLELLRHVRRLAIRRAERAPAAQP